MTAATIEKPGGKAAGVECRVWERFSCDVPASCQPVAARNDRDLHWQATLRDVSVKGLGVVLGRRFERGAALAIELPGTDARPGDTLLARVVHATALPEGRWLLGCSLISELSSDEIAALAGPNSSATPRPSRPPAAPAPKEQVVHGVVLHWLDPRLGSRSFRARRLFLKGNWPVVAGTILRVRRGDAPPDTWARLRVEGCVRQGGQWHLTGSLLGQPSLGVLRSLGLNPSSR